MAYIYSITNKLNGKQYIGKTTKLNPYDRWKEHINNAKLKDNTITHSSIHTMPIIREINKYGSDNFKFRVLEECTDNNIDEREKHYIAVYNTCDGTGYNCTYGGDGISKPSKYCSNHPNSKGKKLKEWKDKQIRIKNGIYGYNTNGEYREWKSQADCAEFIKGDRKNNHNVHISLKSPRKNKLQCKGWYLFHKKGKVIPFNKIIFATKAHSTKVCKKAAEASAVKRRRPVKGINIHTGELITFNSISEASFYIKGEGDRSCVGGIVRNIKNRENGEHWKYAFNHKWNYI